MSHLINYRYKHNVDLDHSNNTKIHVVSNTQTVSEQELIAQWRIYLGYLPDRMATSHRVLSGQDIMYLETEER